MKVLLGAWLLLFSLFFSGCGQRLDYTGEIRAVKNYDESGHERQTRIAGVPKRVLVLYPGAAEAMLELGLDDYILQTIDAYGSEPDHLAARFAALPKVKAAFLPAREEVFAMHPDLIIGWAHNFSASELNEPQNWQDRGIGAYIVPATLPGRRPTLENSVYPFLSDIGKIFEADERAAGYIAECRQKEAAAKAALADMPEATAIVLQDHGRGSYSLYDPGYLIHDVLEKAGLKNLVHAKTAFVGPEQILRYEPEFLVYVSLPGRDGRDLTDAEVMKLVRSNRDLQSLQAVQQGRIINVPFAEVNSGNGRALDALDRLVQGRIKNRYC